MVGDSMISDPVQREKVLGTRALLIGVETLLQTATSRLAGVEFSETSGDVGERLVRLLAAVRNTQSSLMLLVTHWDEEEVR